MRGNTLARIYNSWLSFACDSDFKDRIQGGADEMSIPKSAFMRLLMERGLEHFSKDPMFLFKGVEASK